MTVVTRFAPSPTGFLHIGGARTALFNWLFARHHKGRFLLRIEDTDTTRSTQQAQESILESLAWLQLDLDGDLVFQSQNRARHQEVAYALLEAGHAYHCYCTPEELEQMRRAARKKGEPMRYDGRWRDRSSKDAPSGITPVLRFKAPREGSTLIQDLVQGDVRFDNHQSDDFIILRADGTPTYMLSAVVDDQDMGITHIIRGSDHLTNAWRQSHLYDSLECPPPFFAHIPLIHGPEGTRLSKRHSALGIQNYKEQGYLPEALCNYLTRLGWAHGDEEIFSREQAIQWFTLEGVGRSPARFDRSKLNHLNEHYLRHAEENRLIEEILSRQAVDSPILRTRLKRALPALKHRATTLLDLSQGAEFLFQPPTPTEPLSSSLLVRAAEALRAADPWELKELEAVLRPCAPGGKLGELAQPLRLALTGQKVSIGIFDILYALGREESLRRLTPYIT